MSLQFQPYNGDNGQEARNRWSSTLDSIFQQYQASKQKAEGDRNASTAAQLQYGFDPRDTQFAGSLARIAAADPGQAAVPAQSLPASSPAVPSGAVPQRPDLMSPLGPQQFMAGLGQQGAMDQNVTIPGRPAIQGTQLSDYDQHVKAYIAKRDAATGLESRLKESEINKNNAYAPRGGVMGAAQVAPETVDAAARAVIAGHANLSDFPGFGANSLRAQVTSKVFGMNPGYDVNSAVQDRTFGTGQARFASSGQVEGPLTYMKSAIPNLEHLQSLSDKLPKGDYPIINRAKLALMKQSGDPDVVAYATTNTEVADQIAKILQGGGTGSSTSDAKLRQAMSMFDEGYAPQQMASVVREVRGLLGNRVGALESVQSRFKKGDKSAPASGGGNAAADYVKSLGL